MHCTLSFRLSSIAEIPYNFASMSGKFIFFVCCLVAFTEAMGVLEQICTGPAAPECKVIVKKCFTSETPEVEFKRLCKTFETCEHADPTVKTAYETYIKEQEDGKDFCKAISATADFAQLYPKPMKFFTYFDKVAGPAGSQKLECCLAKGSGMFNADGKPNVAAWKERSNLIVDAASKAAYIAGIDSCAASQTACSEHMFDVCALKKCYEKMKMPH